ncbi:MAG TPA: BatA domain-containing protein, partial [Chitinophagaceae bacterium]|nr:BatA domain-containing protein [Chitinophagaceae bacterium]
MLQLLQPIWLYALTGLLVPVAIHLWNQRPGKTLLVGSIALISANTLAKTKKIRISEWWLLLLRCLLLAAVAFALAGPLWQRKAMPSEKGWVLLPTATAAAAYQHFKGRIDSLLAAGY